ncbi:hypothetical protein ACF1HJ_35535 [Streptomyces sp. NPDC013978]|uniref:hypothetical protein n=1 Tax=Streptomyces sp. NPDC013978 TaxID=3364869 RepID=UPI0036F89887
MPDHERRAWQQPIPGRRRTLTDCCYIGEVGRIGPNCPHRHDTLRQVTIGGKQIGVVPAIEQYTWEGSILDCSIGETASVVLPATFIQQAAG